MESIAAKMLDELSRDGSLSIRCFVAENEDASAETLDRLSKDEDSIVRHCVESNKNTSTEIYNLTRDKNLYM